jgi:hypothetical protein
LGWYLLAVLTVRPGLWGLEGCREAPGKVCSVLGPCSQDLMKIPRNRESLAPFLQGTVYLISCIFMIKFMTLRSKRAKDVVWVGKEK